MFINSDVKHLINNSILASISLYTNMRDKFSLCDGSSYNNVASKTDSVNCAI